jgi:hypothetical protein
VVIHEWRLMDRPYGKEDHDVNGIFSVAGSVAFAG